MHGRNRVGMGDRNFPCISGLASQLLPPFPAESLVLLIFMSIGTVRFKRVNVLYRLSFGNGRREGVCVVIHEIDEEHC